MDNDNITPNQQRRTVIPRNEPDDPGQSPSSSPQNPAADTDTVIPVGPKPSSDAEVTQFLGIPSLSFPLSLRIWSAGYDPSNGQWMWFFDLYHHAARSPVNMPDGWEIRAIPGVTPAPSRAGSALSPHGVLLSLEQTRADPASPAVSVPEGQERFCVAEGSDWELRMSMQPSFRFFVPVRRNVEDHGPDASPPGSP